MPASFVALYDDQCEICQAGVTWIRLLDRQGVVEGRPVSEAAISSLSPSLTLEDCLRELHVVGPEGRIWAGASAVRRLARLFPQTRLLGWILEVPPLNWISDALYRLLARNRYQVSKCRGGTCRTTLTTRPGGRSGYSAFWLCYLMGLLLRLPLIFLSAATFLACNARSFLATRGKRYEFLGGKLQACFLAGFPSDLVPVVFGERFWTLVYDGLLIDPGGTRLRRSLERHLRRFPVGSIHGIVATHAHEEHIGNVARAATALRSPVMSGRLCGSILRRGLRLPRMRALIIGTPAPWTGPIDFIDVRDNTLGRLKAIPTPGHCDDHMALYDPDERVLISGDAFLSTYFTSPNPDVDSRRWLESLRALAELPVEVLVTGHGQIFTLRRDIPDTPGVVIRQDPQACIREKLAFLEWLCARVEEGAREGMPLRAIEASLFPWNRRWSWENVFSDELARVLSGGEFSRTQLVRTFVRRPSVAEPTVYEFVACR